ncbi:MAG: hypothetical protein AAFQ91_28975 [Cyanobacteria bacterium J06621_15]
MKLNHLCISNSSGSISQLIQVIASLAEIISGGTRKKWIYPVLGQVIFNKCIGSEGLSKNSINGSSLFSH